MLVETFGLVLGIVQVVCFVNFIASLHSEQWLHYQIWLITLEREGGGGGADFQLLAG